MRALILGGSGFLGSAVVQALAASGIQVRIICRRKPALGPAGRVKVETYLRDFALLEADDPVFDDVHTVLHLISTTTPASSMEDMAFDLTSNLNPALNLLRIMTERHIPRLIFASSGGTVYGVPGKLPVAEDDPTHPISAHGITKLTIEKFIALHARLSGFQAVSLRIGNPYGPFQLRGVTIGSIARFVQLHRDQETIHIWGDGSVIRDYLWIDDFSAAVTQIMSETNFPSGVFNLGSGKGHSLLDILEEIQRVSGRKVETAFEGRRSIDVPAVVLDTARLRGALPGWEPRVEFSDGIARMWKASAR